MEKICFVMPYHILENRGGGAEVQAWLLARELARRKYDISYICQSVKGKEGLFELIDGVKVKWVKYAHHFRWTNGWEYYRALREINPDLIIQRMSSFITGVIGFYARRHKKKFVWICTDNQSPKRWMFMNNQLEINRAKRINPIKSIIFLFNALIYDLSRHYGMKRVDHAFVQNEVQRKLLKEQFRLDSELMISGHEIPQTRMQTEKRLKNKIVLWVADLSPKKRPEKFIELARIAQNSQFRFIMIGGKEDSSYIKSLFGSKPDNLTWLGRLPFEEVLSWFDKAFFFVNTSISDAEGFPNTYVQAWLRGVPVVTLSVDPDGVIQKFGLGYLAQNVQAIFDYINHLAADRDEYAEIADRILRYAQEKHSISAMAGNFLNAIKK